MILSSCKTEILSSYMCFPYRISLLLISNAKCFLFPQDIYFLFQKTENPNRVNPDFTNDFHSFTHPLEMTVHNIISS